MEGISFAEHGHIFMFLGLTVFLFIYSLLKRNEIKRKTKIAETLSKNNKK